MPYTNWGVRMGWSQPEVRAHDIAQRGSSERAFYSSPPMDAARNAPVTADTAETAHTADTADTDADDAFAGREALRVETAAALRELVHAYVGNEADDDALTALRDWARQESERLRGYEPRDRASVMRRASAGL